MGFRQRLEPAFFARVQQRVRSRMEAEGLDAVLVDHPDDVAYLTGFFHHPGERPVVALLPHRRRRPPCWCPRLEEEHAHWQQAAADVVTYPEFPGVVEPLSVLAAAGAPRRTGRLRRQHERRPACGILTRVCAGTELVPTDAVTVTRYVKEPEEVVLHQEAARITDRMLEAGTALVRDAVAAGGELPSESELAAHVGRGRRRHDVRRARRRRRHRLPGRRAGLRRREQRQAARAPVRIPPAPRRHVHALARLRRRRPVRRGRADVHPRRADRRPGPLLRGRPGRATAGRRHPAPRRSPARSPTPPVST